MKLFDRINISLIYEKHKESFYNYGHENSAGIRKATFSDKFTFIYSPIIMSLMIVILGVKLTSDYINIIITSLSIFVGLLLNLLVLIFDLAKKQKEVIKNLEDQDELVPNIERAKYTTIKELYANISFSIALSIFSILASTLPTLRPQLIIDKISSLCYYQYIRETYLIISNVVAIFFVLEFLLVLLMILKRFFLVFNNEMN